MTKSLQEIGTYWNTGKATGHSYMSVYEEYLSPFRDADITLVELGVLHGESICMWLEYFSRAKIIGVDAGPVTPTPNVRMRETIEHMLAYKGGFRYRHIECPVQEPQVQSHFPPESVDVIIDDASHRPEEVTAAMMHLWPCLKPGGLYWIEDVHTSRSLPLWSHLPGFKVWAKFEDGDRHFRDDDILVLLRKPA